MIFEYELTSYLSIKSYNNRTLNAQVEWISVSKGLLHSANISSTLRHLTTDGQSAIRLMSSKLT